MLKTFVHKSGPGFTGGIRFVHNGKTLWTTKSGIVRITKKDAQSDADWLKKVNLSNEL